MIINGKDCTEACKQTFAKYHQNNPIDKDSLNAVRSIYVAGFDYFLEFIVEKSKFGTVDISQEDIKQNLSVSFEKYKDEIETNSKVTFPDDHLTVMKKVFYDGYLASVAFIGADMV